MKIVIFAHTPPPHHGQSFMVQLMLAGLGGDVRRAASGERREIACFHVNCRVSTGVDDIGTLRFGKLLLLLRYCMEAIWCRLRHGVRTFYYVPAPGKRCALYRDWLVMLLCRPFFPHLVLHWHASGLGAWLDGDGFAIERWITQALLGRPALSIALAEASSQDARWLHSQAIALVPNGIPDPCAEFDPSLLGLRRARTEERQRRCQEPVSAGETPLIFRVLYLAHCTREKGLFDALDGIALFNCRPSPLRAHFTVAGTFMDAREESAFRERIARPDLAGAVTYAGFAAGDKKKSLFEESDCLCFPTYYPAESFPLNLVEAAAYGLSAVVTRWRAIPEIQPPDYPGFVEPKAPAQIADALERLALTDLAEPLRARFLARFSEASHMDQLREAILSAESQG